MNLVILLGFMLVMTGIGTLGHGVYLLVGKGWSLVIGGVLIFLIGFWIVNGAKKLLGK